MFRDLVAETFPSAK